jgi:hypothetical protein
MSSAPSPIPPDDPKRSLIVAQPDNLLHYKTSFSPVSALSCCLGSAESELVTDYRFQALQAMSSTWDCCNSSMILRRWVTGTSL